MLDGGVTSLGSLVRRTMALRLYLMGPTPRQTPGAVNSAACRCACLPVSALLTGTFHVECAKLGWPPPIDPGLRERYDSSRTIAA